MSFVGVVSNIYLTLTKGENAVMMIKNTHTLLKQLVNAVFLSAGLCSVAMSNNSSEVTSISDHTVFNSSQVVDGATILVRDYAHDTVHASISSRALEPDTAYSIWWAIFNEPQHCTEAYVCTVNDLEVFGGDPSVKASVFWAGGFLSDQSGVANTTLRLGTGRTDRELFAQTENHGLQNLLGAEIHVVLRTHGPAGVAGSIAEQIGTANMACPTDGCQNVFASIHLAEQIGGESGNCDYSAANVNGGWGWDPIKGESCPPRS